MLLSPFAALLAFQFAAAAPAPGQEPAAPAVSFDARQKQMFGDDGYVSGDTDLNIALPYGLNVDAAYSFYRSDFSSMTHTAYLGASVDWDERSLGVTGSLTPWSNGYRGDSFGAKASLRSGARDFRTTLGAEAVVVHESQLVDLPAVTLRADITQRTATFSLRQQFYGLRASVDLSQHQYNKDILATSLQLALASLRHPGLAANLAGASGLIQGYPDWTARFGLSQDLELRSMPVTIWANYQNIHLLDTFQSPGPGQLIFQTSQTADSVTAGVDVDVASAFTVGAQYNHVRQSYQPSSDYYGFVLGWRP